MQTTVTLPKNAGRKLIYDTWDIFSNFFINNYKIILTLLAILVFFRFIQLGRNKIKKRRR